MAACDEELLGKKIRLESGATVEVSRSFYGGVLIERSELDKYLNQATIINLLGDEVVSYAISRGIVVERAAVRVGGALHVQLYL